MSAYDVVVIGSGPGGYVAAARASSLGFKTAIVEKDTQLGGTCLHRGCIPTKALLHTADIFAELQDAKQIGIRLEGAQVDFKEAQKYKNRIIQTNAGGVAHLMKSKKVDVLEGFGSLKSPTEVQVTQNKNTQTLQTRFVLVATGSTPRPFSNISFDKRILSSDTILELDHIPGSLCIVGGGVIGVEFASLFARLGTKVTLIEALPRLLNGADEDCSKELTAQFEKQGIALYVSAKVQEIKSGTQSVKVLIETQKQEKLSLESDYLLVSIGRAPNTQKIGLENTAVVLDEKGFIPVSPFMQTKESSVYAIGDCVNTPWLAHVASAEGILAVEHMAGQNPTPIKYDHVPSCVYGDPQVAWCGLSETEAKKRGYEVKIGKFDWVRSGKASILGKKRGFIKFVSDAQYGEILGVHIIGPQATELLAEPALAMQMEATIEDLARTMHAHPTLYEGLYEAASVAAGRAIHG